MNDSRSQEAVNPPDRFVVELVALATDPRPAACRIKQFLKHALRAWGLRCDIIRPAENGGAE